MYSFLSKSCNKKKHPQYFSENIVIKLWMHTSYIMHISTLLDSILRSECCHFLTRSDLPWAECILSCFLKFLSSHVPCSVFHIKFLVTKFFLLIFLLITTTVSLLNSLLWTDTLLMYPCFNFEMHSSIKAKCVISEL